MSNERKSRVVSNKWQRTIEYSTTIDGSPKAFTRELRSHVHTFLHIYETRDTRYTRTCPYSSFNTIEYGTRFDDRSSTCLLSARHDLLIIHDLLFTDFYTSITERSHSHTHTHTDTHLRSVTSIHKILAIHVTRKQRRIIFLSTTNSSLSLPRETLGIFSILGEKYRTKISSEWENLKKSKYNYCLFPFFFFFKKLRRE